MDYRILGPLEVSDGDRLIKLGGDKQRALLAILVLNRNQVVAADRLIEDLWGESPPPSALRTLQAYVSRLRKALDRVGEQAAGHASKHPLAASDGLLLTRGRGYLLRVAPGEVDLDRARELVEAARTAIASGDPERGSTLLLGALALWRGPPLADFMYEAFAQPAIAELEELRLGAVEERIDADLALGRHGRILGEISALVERQPLRERIRGQLMLALYRCGREAEALRVYQEFRRSLSTELGLDPSPRLQELEASILSRSPALEPPPLTSVPAAPAPHPNSRRGGAAGPRLRRGALAGLVLIAISAAVLVASNGGAPKPLLVGANSVAAISPAGAPVRADLPVGSAPTKIGAGAGAVWVANYSARTVSRIDPVSRAIVQTITVGLTPGAIAAGAGGVWVANNFGGTVSRIDPGVNRVVQTTAVGNGPSGIAVDEHSVWVTNSLDGTLSRLSADTGNVVRTIALDGGATDVTTGFGAVWVSDSPDGRVLRIDPRTDQVTDAIRVGTGPTAIAVGYGSVWVTNSLDGTVSRIDPGTSAVSAAIPVGNGPGGISAGANGVWVTNEFGGTVTRIDPNTDRVVRTIAIGNRPRGLAVANGLLWVSAQASSASHRGGTLTVLANAQFGSLDPARPGSLATLLTLPETNDGLTAYKRVGGSDGAQLVPDLAVSLPAATDGGLTYTFRLRQGIRYSSGQPVRPEDFRRAIERDFTLGPGAPLQTDAYTYFEDLVGAPACVSHPTHCDLSRGIVADDAAHTVTFHLARPDPELTAHLSIWAAIAVPAGTASRDAGSQPLPATGPYEISLATPQEVKLIRNPYFREWSHAAQPDGYVDRIIWRLGSSADAEVSGVERGQADYSFDPPPPRRLSEVRTRFAAQLNLSPTDEVIFMGLNTRARPFTDLRVRRAISYAIDRARLTRLLGLDSHPICQMLPSFIPGHRPYCPYTIRPGDGVWRAPNLRMARALIAASGTRGTPITVWNQPGFFTDFTSTGRYVASLLDQLGYPTRIKTFSVNDTTFLPRLEDSRSSPQAYFYTWGPTLPAASEFIGHQFWSCQSFALHSTSNNNLSEFCDPRFDATVRSALAAEATQPSIASSLWAKADREFTDQAPVVSFVNPDEEDLVSRRVGNFQYNPQLGVLIDQLWVR